MSSAEKTPRKAMTPAQLAAQGIQPPSQRQQQPQPGQPLSPPKTLAEQLARILQRPSAQGLYFKGKEVTLDGYHFLECRFDNCTLIASGSNFEIVNCVIDEFTVVKFSPEMTKIIRLYNCMEDGLLGPDPQFQAIKNGDGTVTISGIRYG